MCRRQASAPTCWPIAWATHAAASATPRLVGSLAAGHALFDEEPLAAADEVNSTFDTQGAGMNPLPALARRISVYASLRDIAMDLSMTVNGNVRLGYFGPDNKAAFAPAIFRSVDCTEAFDYFGLIPPDATHQYYRRSTTVRSDIVMLMAEQRVTPGPSSLTALPFGI